MDSIASLFVVYFIFFCALISPGPDFLIVLRNTLGGSVKAGVLTALGVALGLAVHISYCLAGIAVLISQSIMLFNAIKWIGAAYLVYIGWQAIRSKGMSAEALPGAVAPSEKTMFQAFANGFITNLFNPKATLLFLAMFTQMISPSTPIMAQFAFGVACIVTAFVWFSVLAAVMGLPPLRRLYVRASKWVDRTCGVFFMALGVRLALARVS